MTPREGSAGVVGTLWITVRPRSVSAQDQIGEGAADVDADQLHEHASSGGLVKRASGGVAFALPG